MKRHSLISLAGLAMAWQVVSASDPVYPNLPPLAAQAPASTPSEAPAEKPSGFAAQYTPLVPTMPQAPSAGAPAVSRTTLPATMPPTASAVPLATPANNLPASPLTTPPAVLPAAVPAAAPPISNPVAPPATPLGGATPTPLSGVIPAAVPASSEPASPAPAPVEPAPKKAPSPLQGKATAPAQASPIIPVQALEIPATKATPASKTTTATDSTTPASKTAPATLPPATSATPLPALMPPVKASTSNSTGTSKTASTTTTPVPSSTAKTVTPPVPANLAAKTTSAKTPTTTTAATPTTTTVISSTTSPAPTFRSQVREFLGIAESEEQAPAKKEVKSEPVKETVISAPCSNCGGFGCSQCNKCNSGKCGSEFCFGCWLDDHLSCLRHQIDHCCKECGCENGLEGDLIAGFTMYWVQPNFEENSAFHFSNTSAARGAGKDYRYHLEFAPQIWLGFVSNSGLGARLTWWHFNHSSADENLVVPANTTVNLPLDPGFINGGPGSTVFATSSLEVDVWDFEVTQDLRLQQWVLVASGGIRYAYLNKEAFGTINAGDRVNAFRQNFNGAGPTVALAARRLLGDSGLALFGMTRAAILFGSNNEFYFTNNSSITEGPFSTEFAEADILPVLEIELGAEYGRAVGNFRLFGQVGLVGQAWFGEGGSYDSFHNMGFTGFFLRGGVGY